MKFLFPHGPCIRMLTATLFVIDPLQKKSYHSRSKTDNLRKVCLQGWVNGWHLQTWLIVSYTDIKLSLTKKVEAP